MENTLSIRKDYRSELENTQQLCGLLLKTPHYAKMGPDGIFAIVETAKSLGIDPRQALGGGLYYVKGKVEMSSRMMNSLIRAQKHSIIRDEKSDNTICILHGKRADNGDTWTESFSIKEASEAGLLIKKKDRQTGCEINGPWQLFQRDMLFARALSRLARQLFPDIIGNCYVEGEIALADEIQEKPSASRAEIEHVADPLEKLEDDHIEILTCLTAELDEESNKAFFEWISKNFNATSIHDIPRNCFERCRVSLNAKIKYLKDQQKTMAVAV